MITKLVILTFLALILGSLFSALYLLVKPVDDKTKVARALTVRISLSLLLFVLGSEFFLTYRIVFKGKRITKGGALK